MNIKDKILQYTSFALVLLAPLIYWSHRLFPYISSKTYFLYGSIEVIFFIWLYTAIVDRSYRLTKQNILWFTPALLFVLWMTVAGLFGYNLEMSFWSSFARGTGLLTLYHCLAFSIVIASLVNKHGINYLNKFINYFLIGSFILSISIWLGDNFFINRLEMLKFSNEGGLMGQSTLAATYLTFALAFSIFMFFKKDVTNRMRYWLVFVILTILASPLFFSLLNLFKGTSVLGSARAAILSIPVIIVVAYTFYLSLSNKKIIRNIGISMCIIGIASFSIFWVQLMNPSTKIHNAFAQEARETRFIFWDIADKALSTHPLLGYGPENYMVAFQENFNPDLLLSQNNTEGWDDRAHNIYYDIGVSGGYPAIAFYALFLLSTLVLIYKAKNINKINRAQASVLGALVIGYVFQNLFAFDSNLSIFVIFMLFGVLNSLAFLDKEGYVASPKIKDNDKYLLLFGITILFAVSWVFFTYMPTRKSKAFAETFASTIDKRSQLYPDLLKGSVVGQGWDVSGLAFDSYREYVSNAIQLKNNKQILPYLVNNLNSLLDYLYKVAENNTTDYRLYITIGYLENTLTYMSDRPYTPELKARLLSVLDKAQKLAPNNPNVYWGIAQAKVWSGDFAGTEEAYRKAMEVAPNLPGSYTLFMKYAQALGNQKLFNEIASEAQKNVADFKYN